MPRQQTIRINQGYVVDSKWEALAVAGRGLARLAQLAWRWRTELGLVAAVAALRLLAGRHLSGGAALAATLAVVAAAVL